MKALPYLLAALVLGAGLFAFLRAEPASTPSDRPARADAPTPDETAREPARGATVSPPPDHPPASPSSGGSARGASPRSPMGSENEEPATLAWTVPSTWQAAPNPNAFRLATFHVTGNDEVEVSIARAGGSAEANIERWVHQFGDASSPQRSDRTVHGLRVAVVEVSGTYGGGPTMMPGSPSTAHPGWTLVGAVVQPADGSSYFFKLIGPSAQVQAARASFDGLLGSLQPR